MIKILESGKVKHSIIVIFFKGKSLPEHCTPMPRDPEPEINVPLNMDFSEMYFSMLSKNPSIKDGAILIQEDCDCPLLRGFSYRIYPPPLNVPREKNMGSGYNSSLDFSGVKGVRCVYFIDSSSVRKFVKGRVIRLC